MGLGLITISNKETFVHMFFPYLDLLIREKDFKRGDFKPNLPIQKNFPCTNGGEKEQGIMLLL
jgi:hypothetical protein